MRAFALAIRHAREKKGMSQREATRQLDWAQGKLSLLENAQRAKLPPRSEVEQLDALYDAGGDLLRVAGYTTAALPDDLETALRGVVEHHVNELLKDVRQIFDPDDE